MKTHFIVAAILAVFAITAQAGNDNANPCGNNGNNCNTTATGGNANANAIGVGVGLGGKATVGDITNKNQNTNAQGQLQGQQQGQMQNAISSSGVKNSGNSTSVSVSEGGNAKQGQSMDNSWSYSHTNVEPKVANSAAGLVVQVASACGGSLGGTGQGFNGGGALGLSFEFFDCKIMREAAFMIALDVGNGELVRAGLQHVARNIPRVGETLMAVSPAFKVYPNRPTKQQWTKDLNSASGRK